MTPMPASVSPTSSVAAAERVMREYACHHVPVVENDRVVGMISSHDLVKALVLRPESGSEVLNQSSLKSRRVAEIMQRKVTVLPHTATLVDAAAALATGDLHALPVVAPDNVLAGIVTSTDLIEALVDGLKHPLAGPAEPAKPAAAEERVGGPQVQVLREVYRAATLYLKSGRGELEHGRLLQAVNKAREALRGTELHI
jgi:acetoin utilization protein AcuB